MPAEQTNPVAQGEGEGPQGTGGPFQIEMPAPTLWPLVLALGVGLLAVGLLTDLAYSVLGALLAILALAGWVRQQLPDHGREWVELAPPQMRPRPVGESRLAVEVWREGARSGRAQIPEKIHPYSAGALGGICGGIAMAILALAYGLLSGHGIWYPVNLLAGTVIPHFGQKMADLERFSWVGLIVGIAIHVIASVGNGLVAGVLLPMMPRWPLIWAGIVAPLLWCGAVYGFMGVINPLLERHVDWPWFIASQFAYGLVLGLVVLRSEKVPVNPLGSQRRNREVRTRERAHDRDGEGHS